MLTVTRHLCLTVLLALLVGHASFAVHAASHDLVEVAECQLCMSYGDTSEALGYEPELGVPPVQDIRIGGAEDHLHASRVADFVRPRGPPLAS